MLSGLISPCIILHLCNTSIVCSSSMVMYMMNGSASYNMYVTSTYSVHVVYITCVCSVHVVYITCAYLYVIANGRPGYLKVSTRQTNNITVTCMKTNALHDGYIPTQARATNNNTANTCKLYIFIFSA